jgi:BMFP domain-containing protein YqiC
VGIAICWSIISSAFCDSSYAGTLNTIARKPGHDKDTADRPLNRPKRIAIVFPRVRAEFIESRQETDMTQTNNRFFDEIGRLMNDAAGAAQGVKREFDTVMRTQAEKFLRDMDLVKREEFEAVKDMARLAREENEALKARIAALEAKLGG